MSQKCPPLWSPGLCALGVSPAWTVWALLLQRDDYCGWSGRPGCLLVWLVSRACFLEVASHLWLGLGNEVASYRGPGVLG